MKYQVDDWRFRLAEDDVLAVELFLDNGQKAILEVLPLTYNNTQSPAGNEIIVWCEMPGELIDEGTCQARWISRPPDSRCPWSRVELPSGLVGQIEEHLAGQPRPVV